MSKKGQSGKRKTGNSRSTAPGPRTSSRPPVGDGAGNRGQASAQPPFATSPSFGAPPVTGMSTTLLMGRLTLPSANGLVVAERVAVAEQLEPSYAQSFPAETSGTRLTEDTREGERDEQEESGPRIVAHGVLVTPQKATEIAHEDEKVIVAANDTPEAAEATDTTDTTETSHARSARDANPNHAALAPAAGTDPDEISIPPHVQTIADIDDKFFADGDKAHHDEPMRRAALAAELALEEDEDAVRAHKMTPAVRARRARFAKYVKAAVGFSAVVCLAALVRVGISRGHHEEPATASIASMMPVETVAAAAPPAPAPLPEVVPVAAVMVEPVAPVAAAVPVVAPVVAEAVAPPAAPVAADPAVAAAAPSDVPTKTAAEEKKISRQALERGNTKVAIEAGERAVALDPADGDSWLILGAAYQEKGKLADARRCFSACVKQGKKGAVGECSAMLR